MHSTNQWRGKCVREPSPNRKAKLSVTSGALCWRCGNATIQAGRGPAQPRKCTATLAADSFKEPIDPNGENHQPKLGGGGSSHTQMHKHTHTNAHKHTEKQTQTHTHTHTYIYIYMYQSLGHVPPPPPMVWSPTPPHHPHLGDDAGNAGDAVQYRVRTPPFTP